MKSINLLYTVTFAIGASLTGCSDSFLDMRNYGAYDELDSETKITWYVNNLYDQYYWGYTSPNQTLVGAWNNYDNLTEEAWGISDKTNESNPRAEIEDLSSAFMPDYFGKKLKSGGSPDASAYNRIRNCNILLRDIDNSGVSQDVIDKAKGQALFLRAIQMFDLLRIYGPTPIVTTVINAEVLDTDLPRPTTTQVVEQIITDLNNASHLLPDEWGASDYGRLTRKAALAYKSRVLLFYASPVFNRDWNNPQNERWQHALRASQAAVEEFGGAEALLGSCTDAKGWAEMLAASSNTSAAHKESIMLTLCTTETNGDVQHNGWEGDCRPTSQGGGGGHEVPIEIIDAFPMEDGSRPTDDVKIANGSLTFMLNRDPRFYRTFTFSGMDWPYKGAESDTIWAYTWKGSKSDVPNDEGVYVFERLGSESNSIASPAFVCKMTDRNADPEESFANSGIDINEFRAAELVLNLAECEAATGNVQEAVRLIGLIRKRVGITSNNNYGIGNITDKNQAIEACLYERRIELAFEGKRYWDIWRWLLYDGGQDPVLPLSDINTCNALGVEQLNGTHRTAKYVDVNPSLYPETSEEDPLLAIRAEANIGANVDSPTFKEDLLRVANFWTQYFKFGDSLDPVDQDTNKDQANISWRGNYYINGLSKTILDNNPWLGQTVGWGDQNGASGTITFQDSGNITVE